MKSNSFKSNAFVRNRNKNKIDMNMKTSSSSSSATNLSQMGSGLDFEGNCVIKVIGVGGGGGNAIVRMMETGVHGVDFGVMNTDTQALSHHRFKNIPALNIGSEVSRGLGAGGNPDVGRMAAEESRQDIFNMVKGSDMVFITAGMGGGTGSGAAPIVAEVAREAGALTVGVVTKPFGFEGRRRMQQAIKAIESLRDKVDTLIVVSNDRLLEIIPENTPVQRAFAVADDVLRQGVVGISDIIIRPGIINVDFADVRAIMRDAGTSLMGVGRGTGKSRATDAATAAISSPLLDFPITNARGVVFNVVGGPDMTIQEVNMAAEVIYDAVDSNANIIFGALIDDTVTNGEMSITVVATGFPVEADGSPSSTSMTVGEAIKRSSSSSSSSDLPFTKGRFAVEENAADVQYKKASEGVVKGNENNNDVPDFLNKLKRRR